MIWCTVHCDEIWIKEQNRKYIMQNCFQHYYYMLIVERFFRSKIDHFAIDDISIGLSQYQPNLTLIASINVCHPIKKVFTTILKHPIQHEIIPT